MVDFNRIPSLQLSCICYCGGAHFCRFSKGVEDEDTHHTAMGKSRQICYGPLIFFLGIIGHWNLRNDVKLYVPILVANLWNRCRVASKSCCVTFGFCMVYLLLRSPHSPCTVYVPCDERDQHFNSKTIKRYIRHVSFPPLTWHARIAKAPKHYMHSKSAVRVVQKRKMQHRSKLMTCIFLH